MTPIKFPDGAAHAPTTKRAQHTLAKNGAVWSAAAVLADYTNGEWRVQIDGVPYFLRHDPADARYIGGGWPNAIPTAFILRKSASGATIGGLILEIWDVNYQGHGEFHIEGVDG